MPTKTYWDTVEEMAARLDEDGPMPRADVLTLWKWDQMKVNLLDDKGLTWRGESFKNQGWSVLMVLKVAQGTTPLVVFITEKDTTGCVRVLLRMLEEGLLELREDKFA